MVEKTEEERKGEERIKLEAQLVSMIRSLDAIGVTLGGFICVAVVPDGPGLYGKKIREICNDLNRIDPILHPHIMTLLEEKTGLPVEENAGIPKDGGDSNGR